MNKWIGIGYAVDTPELRTTQNGVSVANFSIGVTRRFPDQNGDRQSDFFNIIAWRKLGENCAKYIEKGTQVAVVGEVQTRSYEAKDGTKRYITEIISDEVTFLGSSKSNSQLKQAQTSDESEIDAPF